MDTKITIGKIIKYYRNKIGYSQEKLADNICDRKYIGKIENNKQVPTIDIVDKLSAKLNVNLYDMYSLISSHHDFDTHEKIEELDSFFATGIENNLDKFLELISDIENLESFKSGEPLQFLLYSKAMCVPYIEKNLDLAISYTERALKVKYSTCDKLFNKNNFFSHIDLILINFMGIWLANKAELDKSFLYFNFLYDYLIEILSQNLYSVYRNYHFAINLLGKVTTDIFFFSGEQKTSCLEKINTVISIYKNLNYSQGVPELLLCKCYILYKKGLFAEIPPLIKQADIIGDFFYSKEKMLGIKKEILFDLYDVIIN